MTRDQRRRQRRIGEVREILQGNYLGHYATAQALLALFERWTREDRP